MATSRREFDALLDQFGPEVAEGFRQSIDEIKSRIVLKQVIDALRVGNIEAAIAAMAIEPAAFAPLVSAIEQAYIAGGTWSAKNFPKLPAGTRVVVRFDWRNPRAEAWLRRESSQLVTGIIAEQMNTIREALVTGLSRGQNPRATALEIVGRVNRATGKREGGIIGLSEPQYRALENLHARLSSGDSVQMRQVFDMKLRDKRFDAAIRKAIDAGKPVAQSDIEKMAQRYADRALKHRGDVIGRTETLTAVNAADDEAFRQGLAKTNYTEADVQSFWDAVGDKRTRHSHGVMDGQMREGIDTPFQSPSGALMRFPGDRSLGAPAKEIVGCRCRKRKRIDFFRRRA